MFCPAKQVRSVCWPDAIACGFSHIFIYQHHPKGGYWMDNAFSRGLLTTLWVVLVYFIPILPEVCKFMIANKTWNSVDLCRRWQGDRVLRRGRHWLYLRGWTEVWEACSWPDEGGTDYQPSDQLGSFSQLRSKYSIVLSPAPNLVPTFGEHRFLTIRYVIKEFSMCSWWAFEMLRSKWAHKWYDLVVSCSFLCKRQTIESIPEWIPGRMFKISESFQRLVWRCLAHSQRDDLSQIWQHRSFSRLW